MSYFSEFRTNWRALAASSLGLAVGYTFINYVTNIFSPHLIRELGWSKADFALLGLIVIVAAVCQPVAGRLADRFGVRRMALVGVISAPLLFVLLSRMTGPFWQFYLINVLQVVLVGGTTSAVIYTRLIAERFDLARGVALGVTACAPAAAGALLAPVMSELADLYGWRTGYLLVAGFVALAGLLAVALIPGDGGARPARAASAEPPSLVDYRALFRDRTFQILIAGMLLCNLTLTLQMTQLKIVLLDLGVGGSASSLMISVYGFGVIAGRLLCGVALDRYSPHLVAAASMSAPAIGLLLLASGTASGLFAGLAVALLGLAMGAEGDVGAYLVMRYFRRAIYGSVFGLLMGALSLSGAVGAVLLSVTLAASDGSFRPFLVLSGVAALIGGSLFLLLGNRPATGHGSPVAAPH